MKDNEILYSYAPLNDLFGEPAFVMRVTTPRDLSAQGRVTVIYFIVLILISGTSIWIVMADLLERAVLSSLFPLSRKLTGIWASRDFSARVSATGDDEIARLGLSVNGMLEEPEKPPRQLNTCLIQSEERYRLFFNSITDPVIVYPS